MIKVSCYDTSKSTEIVIVSQRMHAPVNADVDLCPFDRSMKGISLANAFNFLFQFLHNFSV